MAGWVKVKTILREQTPISVCETKAEKGLCSRKLKQDSD